MTSPINLDAAAVPLKFKRLHRQAKLPAYATDGSACIDLSATDAGVVPVGASHNFGSGLAFEVPAGHVMLVFSRSGHGFKHGVRLPNGVGVIDSDYRGEVSVGLHNDGDAPFVVNEGDRIAQAMIVPIPRIELVEIDELTDTARGTGGFGSTGTSAHPADPPRQISDREWAALPAGDRDPRY